MYQRFFIFPCIKSYLLDELNGNGVWSILNLTPKFVDTQNKNVGTTGDYNYSNYALLAMFWLNLSKVIIFKRYEKFTIKLIETLPYNIIILQLKLMEAKYGIF